MAVYGGPEITTSGLVLYLDAANKKSYPGTGTSWNDLSGNGNNGTLTNGPIFSTENKGNIIFDETNDIITFNNSINVGNEYTISIWCLPSSAERRTLIANSYTYALNKGFLFNIGNSGTDFFISNGQDQNNARSPTGLISSNKWQMLSAVVKSGSPIKLLYNDKEVASYPRQDTMTISIEYNADVLYIGGWYNQGSYYVGDRYGGKIGPISLYNRSLSQSEILQNYNALKGRYGL